MSYPPEPQGPLPSRPARPTYVTAAAVIMFIIAGLAVISAITYLSILGQLVDGFRKRAAQTNATSADIDTIATAVSVVTVLVAILLLIFAALLVILAVGNLRGSNTTRIFTWFVCVLGFLCGCCCLFGTLGQVSVAVTMNTPQADAPTAEQLGAALADSYPQWWLAINTTLCGLALLGYIAVAVLLALPTSNPYFRSPVPPQWHPPPG